MVRVHVRPPPHPPSTPQQHSVRAVRLMDFNAGAYFPPRRVSLATGRRPPILHRAAVGEDFFQRKQQTIRLTGRGGSPRPARTCPRRRPFRRPRGPCGPTGALEFGVQTVRAHGGCLGGGRRRRTRQAAISPGETHAVFDPGVSEWGNPASSRMPPPREPNSAAGARPGEVKHLSSRRKRKKDRFRK